MNFKPPSRSLYLAGLAVLTAVIDGVFGTAVRAQSPTGTALPIDLAAYDENSGVVVKREAPGLRISWPVSGSEKGEVVLNLDPAPNRPLIEKLAVYGTATGEPQATTLMTRVGNGCRGGSRLRATITSSTPWSFSVDRGRKEETTCRGNSKCPDL